MHRLYNNEMNNQRLEECSANKQRQWKKMLYSLSMFHSVALGRLQSTRVTDQEWEIMVYYLKLGMDLDVMEGFN